MSAKVNAVRPMPKTKTEKNTSLVTEPVFVFGSNIAGRHDGGAGAFAVAFHGAVAGQGSGPQGNSYAIPTQNSEFQALPLAVIKNYVDGFLQYAEKHSPQLFQVTRVGCGSAEYKDEQMAPLFKRAGANCLLPGLWLRVLGSTSTPRIIILDPLALLGHQNAQQCLDEYFSLNLPLWGAKSVEIVSVGQSKSLVANDAYARRRKFRHRIIGANPDYYGAEADLARNTKAVWYATHLIWITDPEQTTTRRRVRLISMATRYGLMVDEVVIGRRE